jgi:hypothetical protein
MLNTVAGSKDIDKTIDGTGKSFYMVPEGPIISIQQVKIGDNVLSTDEYYIRGTMIQLKNNVFTPFMQNITLKYKVGYNLKFAYDEVNKKYNFTDKKERLINEYCILSASMALWTTQIGATYDDVVRYSVAGTEISKGEPYTNIRAAVIQAGQILERYKMQMQRIRWIEIS